MRACLARTYGPPGILTYETLPTPVPGPGEVRVRIRATTVNSADIRIRGLSLPRGFSPLGRLMLGFEGPRQPVLGTELAGEVEALGAGVTQFKEGDRVFAFPGGAMGCHAEYRCLRANPTSAPTTRFSPFSGSFAGVSAVLSICDFANSRFSLEYF